jgi:hypothetical protein
MNLKSIRRIVDDAQEVSNAAAMHWNAVKYDTMATKRPKGIIIGPPEPKELARTKQWLTRAVKELRITLRTFRP